MKHTILHSFWFSSLFNQKAVLWKVFVVKSKNIHTFYCLNKLKFNRFKFIQLIYLKWPHFFYNFAIYLAWSIDVNKIHFQLLPSFIVKVIFVLNRWDNSIWDREIRTIINDRAYHFCCLFQPVAGLNGLVIFFDQLNKKKQQKKTNKYVSCDTKVNRNTFTYIARDKMMSDQRKDIFQWIVHILWMNKKISGHVNKRVASERALVHSQQHKIFWFYSLHGWQSIYICMQHLHWILSHKQNTKEETTTKSAAARSVDHYTNRKTIAHSE